MTGLLASVQRKASSPLLLVTDYTNRPLRQACEELGISYLDRSGWAYIKTADPVVFIRTEGTDRPAPRVASEVIRLNGVAAGRILRTLLEIDPPIGVRELARDAQVRSPGSVSKLLPTLVSAGAVERDDDGRVVLVNRRVLLDRWTRDYSFLNSNAVVYNYLAPRGLDSVVQQLKSARGVCVTGAFAGRELLRRNTVSVVPPTTLTLYVEDPLTISADLGLVEVARPASNVIMAAPRDFDLVSAPLRGDSGLPLAPRAQVLADLLTLPGRESLMAEQIMDQLEDADATWSRS